MIWSRVSLALSIHVDIEEVQSMSKQRSRTVEVSPDWLVAPFCCASDLLFLMDLVIFCGFELCDFADFFAIYVLIE